MQAQKQTQLPPEDPVAFCTTASIHGAAAQGQQLLTALQAIHGMRSEAGTPPDCCSFIELPYSPCPRSLSTCFLLENPWQTLVRLVRRPGDHEHHLNNTILVVWKEYSEPNICIGVITMETLYAPASGKLQSLCRMGQTLKDLLCRRPQLGLHVQAALHQRIHFSRQLLRHPARISILL